MAVAKLEFFKHEKGNHDETWYYLAKDTDTGRVFIIHEWAARADIGEREMEIEDFLASKKGSSAYSNLIRIVGSLVP